MKKLATIILGLAASLSLQNLGAQATATTDPVGGIQSTITGTAGGTGLTFYSPTLRNSPSFSGVITAITSTTISVSGTPFASNQFAGANGAHYIEISKDASHDVVDADGSGPGLASYGPAHGAMSDITSNTTSVITIGDNLTSLVAVGDSFVVRKHQTVNDVFGENNTAGLLGTADFDPNAADNLIIFNNSSKAGLILYYSTNTNYGPAYSGWLDSSTVNRGSEILYPEQGIYIKRIASSNTSLTHSASIGVGRSQFPIEHGLNIVGSPFPVPVTLDNSGLYTGDPNTGVKGTDDFDINNADTVTIFDLSGNSDSYYYSTNTAYGPAYTGWFNSGLVASGSVEIKPETSFIVTRTAALPAYTWKPALIINGLN